MEIGQKRWIIKTIKPIAPEDVKRKLFLLIIILTKSLRKSTLRLPSNSGADYLKDLKRRPSITMEIGGHLKADD